ncbi:MAG: hypothetical protein KKA05_07340, partial [Alphaproteobacteria bacterium]|nr:hypothetical protein [Alphaproteobacteria bacterium]
MAEAAAAPRSAVTDGRFVALLAALLIYAARGTPTPDVIGVPEIFMAILLVLAVGPAGVLAALHPVAHAGWMRAAQILMLYGLSIPILAGLAQGNDPALMVRDMAAFLFLLLPLFFYPLVRQSPARIVILTMAAVTVGLAFSWRVLFSAFLTHDGFEGILARMHPADPAYLANAPTVLFTALLLMGLAGLRLYVAPRPKACVMAAALAVLGALPFVTMALILQRASIGLGLAGLAFLLLVAFVRRPYRTVPLLLVVACVLAVVGSWLGMVINDLAAKTVAVGLNSRWQEAAAVLARV